MKVKSSSSQTLRGICSVTFDVADGSRKGSAAPRPAKSPSRSGSQKAAEDPADHQREPKRSQTYRKPQASLLREKRPRPDVTENTAAKKKHVRGEDDDAEADHVENTRDIPCASDLNVLEDKTLLSQPLTTEENNLSEAMKAEGAAELDDGDTGDDVGSRTEKSEEADEQVETTEEAAEVAHLEQPYSAEPDVDSSTAPSKHPRFIVRKRNERVRKRKSRSLRYVKVLQACIVTQLK